MLQLRRSTRVVLTALTAMVVTACAGFGASHKTEVDYRKRAADLARELNRKNALIEDLREKNQVLAAQASRLKPTLPREEKKPKQVEALSVSVPTESSEHLLYAKVMTSYQAADSPELQKAVKLFLKTFSDSQYADNALFLSAMLAVQKGDLAYAHRALDLLLKDYPTGNKAVSALFAKGALYKKEGKLKDARVAFNEVTHQYPGSPESFRVPVELRLIQQLQKAGSK
jgi:TolA-binding protein